MFLVNVFIVIKLGGCMNVQFTLESGQVFRYWKESNGYCVVHGKHSFFVGLDGRYSGISADDFNTFFRMDEDYNAIVSALVQDDVLKNALTAYPGLKLLRQDPWECTISFLCSSATNIPRIQRDLNNIARVFGHENNGVHYFPKIGEIDDVEKLKQCGTGYRAKFIHAVNGIVTRRFFLQLKKMDYETAHDALMELPGIGPKIADCILLFSCDQMSAFPIDTWMEKVLV